MGDSIVSDEAMSCIRRTCYKAGREGREVYTVRAGSPLVRCEKCDNWGAMVGDRPADYCPVVQRCTRPTDWCCWAAREKGASDGR